MKINKVWKMLVEEKEYTTKWFLNNLRRDFQVHNIFRFNNTLKI